MANMTLLERFSELLTRKTFESLSGKVVKEAKLRVLDSLGVAVLGYTMEVHKPVLMVLLNSDAKTESTIIGEGLKLSCTSASLVNSIMMSSTTFEDGCRFGGVHPSSACISAALSVGEKLDVDGKSFLTSVVVGYDILLRVAIAIYPDIVKKGFHPTSVVGSIGAAATASKLLNLNREEVANALAISSMLGSGLLGAVHSPSHPIQVGKSCQNGVFAALLAKEGVVGPRRILEDGFLTTFGNQDSVGSIIVKNSDDTLLKTYTKIHGGCRLAHASIDAVMDLMSTVKLSLNDIKSITIKLSAMSSLFASHDIKTAWEARFSTPFAIAATLLYGDAFIDKFTDEYVNDPQIRNLMRKIIIEYDSSLDVNYPRTRGAEVMLTDINGHTHTNKVDLPRGEPELPLHESVIINKYERLTRGVLDDNAIEEIKSIVFRIEEINHMAHLLTLLKARS